MNTFTRLAVAIALVPLSVTAHAAGPKPTRPSDAELLRLPPYCKAKISGSKEEVTMWEQRFGKEIFMHMHHFCFGLNELNRSRVDLDKGMRGYYAQRAVKEFEYVIHAWPAAHQMNLKARQYKMLAESMSIRN